MLFHSPKFSALRVNIRPPVEIYHPTLPKKIGEVTPLVAEFAKHGGESTVTTPDGETVIVADIRGHYFDSVVAQEELGWTDEEREEVEQGLLALSRREPEKVVPVEPAKAHVPWPTYDDTPRDKIVEFAVALGLTAEALAYEAENQNRKTVVQPLQEIVFAANAEAEAEGALTAV